MRLRRGLVLGLVAGAVATVGAFAAHELAIARQKPIVVMRFLAGYFDRKGKFVATAGHGASNVDRNAVLMFVLSGAADTGPNIEATLPLTLSEQSEIAAIFPKLRADPPTATAAEERRFRELGGDVRVLLEPGVIGRKPSTDRAAQVVATGSINADSVHIVATSGGGEALADGVFFKVRKRNGRRNRLRRFIFHPSYRVATFGRPGEIDYNPEGLAANTTYSIRMDGGNGATNLLTVVTNLDGTPLAEPYTTTITTTDRYLQDFTRPEIRETSPTDGSVNVASDADVDITFSEPMDISSFQPPRSQNDPAATVRMRYTLSPANGVLAGRNVLAQVRVKPQTAGNVVQLRPLQGFGRGPYEIEVTITAGVTDLSGNNIIREQQFVFTTEQDDTAEELGAIDETFDTTAKRDSQFTIANVSGDNTLADWNTAANPGVLTTVVSSAAFATQGPTPTSQVNVWFLRAVRWQMLFPSNDMGGRARTLTGFSWHETGTQLNLTYPNTQVKIGHANDVVAGGGFPGGATPPGPSASYYRSAPTTVSPSVNYTIPASSGNPNWVPGPTWVGPWNFDGQNSVILEVEHYGNGTAASSENWGMDGTYSLNAMTYSLFQDNPPVIASATWYMSTRWNFLAPGAEAQSLWYNVLQPAVRWVPQQLVPFQQPQGTAVSIRWQGAKPDLNDATLLDPSTITAWTTDIRTLAGNPFVRWHVELINNVSTGQSATIDTLTIPYTYR